MGTIDPLQNTALPRKDKKKRRNKQDPLSFDFGPISNTTETQTVLFFHIFINPNNESLTWSIVQEMLEARNKNPAVKDNTLLFLTVGGKRGGNNNGMPSRLVCHNCHHIGHFDEGFEELTLEALYRYCRDVRPMDHVVYVHNKGSFTPSEKNNLMRKHASKGVFHKRCQDGLSLGFDLCCSKFVGFPFASCVGNMFLTTCDYVHKLLPPREFGRRRHEIHDQMLRQVPKVFTVNESLTNGNKIMFRVTKNRWSIDRGPWVGEGRYFTEHWIASHPSVRPVYVYPRRKMLDFSVVNPDTSWRPVLRRTFPRAETHQKLAAPLFRLEGRMYLYDQLYGELPPNNSWAWDFYHLREKNDTTDLEENT